MNEDLEALMKLMPPPDDPPNADVDFEIIERELEIAYPPDFKEFVAVYGRSQWCDYARPMYPRGHDLKTIEEFKGKMSRIFSEELADTIYDEDFEEIEFPKYPEEGGLFVFLIDSSGGWHFWLMEGAPEQWPIVCWRGGQTAVVRELNMTQMFLRWLERKEPAVKLWGNLDSIPPERIRLD